MSDTMYNSGGSSGEQFGGSPLPQNAPFNALGFVFGSGSMDVSGTSLGGQVSPQGMMHASITGGHGRLHGPVRIFVRRRQDPAKKKVQITPPPGGKRIAPGSKEEKKLKEAFEKAKKRVDAAIKDAKAILNDPNGSTAEAARFKKYFGTTDPAAVQKVLNHFTKMKELMEGDLTDRIWYDGNSEEGGANRADTQAGGTDRWTMAYTIDFFKNTPMEGADGAIAVVIHEFSHAAFDSGDKKPYMAMQFEDLERQIPGAAAAEKAARLSKWANTPDPGGNSGPRAAVLEGDSYKFFAAEADGIAIPPPPAPRPPGPWTGPAGAPNPWVPPPSGSGYYNPFLFPHYRR